MTQLNDFTKKYIMNTNFEKTFERSIKIIKTGLHEGNVWFEATQFHSIKVTPITSF